MVLFSPIRYPKPQSVDADTEIPVNDDGTGSAELVAGVIMTVSVSSTDDIEHFPRMLPSVIRPCAETSVSRRLEFGISVRTAGVRVRAAPAMIGPTTPAARVTTIRVSTSSTQLPRRLITGAKLLPEVAVTFMSCCSRHAARL
jgi:hypothetical protein